MLVMCGGLQVFSVTCHIVNLRHVSGPCCTGAHMFQLGWQPACLRELITAHFGVMVTNTGRNALQCHSYRHTAHLSVMVTGMCRTKPSFTVEFLGHLSSSGIAFLDSGIPTADL